MDQRNMVIAVGGIIVSLGILAVGFNKLSPDNFQPEWRYPESQSEEEFEEPRSENSTRIIVGGTMCKRCSSRKIRK